MTKIHLEKPLLLALLFAGAAVAARAAIGQFQFLVSVRSPLVGEGICALAATLLLLARDSRPEKCSPVPRWALPAVLILTALCLSATLWFPLVCDEYGLAAQGRTMGWSAAGFTHAGADRFFRPIANLTLALDAGWSGLDPFGWHVLSLCLHLLDTALVWLLAWRLFRRPALACWAAALFGMHGSRPEAAAFLARFDQLATLFVLAGLLLLDRYLDSESTAWLASAHIVMLAGLLSKESAYVFPLLALWLLFLRGRLRQWRATVGFFAITAAVFVYRWMLLGGIGGYPDRATGRAAILNIRPLALLKGLTLREWGLLYFPINWSVQPEPWLALALALMLAALVYLALRAKTEQREVAWAAMFTIMASLPVAHMLLIGADLRGSAHLYMPSVGFSLLLGTAIDGVSNARARRTAGVAILVFHIAALEHNVRIWDRTAHLADAVCRMATSEALRANTPPVFENPPLILDGIAFFTNGLPECVAMHAPGSKIVVAFDPDLPAPEPGTPVFVWDDRSRSFVPK